MTPDFALSLAFLFLTVSSVILGAALALVMVRRQKRGRGSQ